MCRCYVIIHEDMYWTLSQLVNSRSNPMSYIAVPDIILDLVCCLNIALYVVAFRLGRVKDVNFKV